MYAVFSLPSGIYFLIVQSCICILKASVCLFFAYFKVLFGDVVSVHHIDCTTYVEIAILRAY
jgi:hypothetical protein